MPKLDLDTIPQTNVTGYPARLAFDDLLMQDGIEQTRLSVINMAHHGDNWRTNRCTIAHLVLFALGNRTSCLTL